MSRTYKDSPNYKSNRRPGGRSRQRNLSVRAVRREPADLRKLAKAVIALAIAEAQAESAHEDRPKHERSPEEPADVD